MLKLEENGDSLWMRNFGGDGDDEAFSIQETNDHGFIMGGYGFASLMKTDSFGEMEWS